jgi:hypothetical protein
VVHQHVLYQGTTSVVPQRTSLIKRALAPEGSFKGCKTVDAGASVKDKEFILSEIRRTAEINGGKPLGIGKFGRETGIAQHEWSGIHWARWSDAFGEAGFEPLDWNQSLNEERMIYSMAGLVRKYSRFSVKPEILIEKRSNAQVPTPSLFFRKFGGRSGAIRKVRDYCSSREEFSDVFCNFGARGT